METGLYLRFWAVVPVIHHHNYYSGHILEDISPNGYFPLMFFLSTQAHVTNKLCPDITVQITDVADIFLSLLNVTLKTKQIELWHHCVVEMICFSLFIQRYKVSRVLNVMFAYEQMENLWTLLLRGLMALSKDPAVLLVFRTHHQ